ncbi:unnamed protein product [Urochloa humidicola]
MSSNKVQLIMKGDRFQFGDEQLPSRGVPVRLVSIPEYTVGETGGTVVVCCYSKIGEGLMKKSLAVRHDSDKVFLDDINTGDEYQQWVLDKKYGSIKGEDQGTFALFNRATGQALWQSLGEGKHYHLSLMKFGDAPPYLDESALWKKEDKDGFCRIYAATNECYLKVDNDNNVVLQKAERRVSLKFGGSGEKKWKIMPLR